MRPGIALILTALVAVAMFFADIFVGSVDLSVSDVAGYLLGATHECAGNDLIIEIRLMRALTAIIAGAALTINGLQMQSLFRNPLAGPYVLGVSSGASLGVALCLLGVPMAATFAGDIAGDFAIVAAAWAGSAAVMAAVAVLSTRVADVMSILILGIMFSAGVGSVVQILQYVSTDEALKNYVVWGMGSLSEVTPMRMAILAPCFVAGLIVSSFTIKPLNLMMIGEEYARCSGIDTRRSRMAVFASTTLLTGSVTAFCGPIGFVGLAVPHIAKWIVKGHNHLTLMPITALAGAAIMSGCDMLSKIYALPISSFTSVIGIPIVILIVLKINRKHA